MDQQAVIETRQALHAVGESILAGQQFRSHAELKLKVTPGGFGQCFGSLRVEGTDLVGDGLRVPLVGTVRAIAASVGLEPDRLEEVYHEHAVLGPDDELAVDPGAAQLLSDWFTRGAAALQELDPSAEIILWPEHFDLGISLDEVNYGVSPGDGGHPQPYAYVGPWTPREGDFWNASFGALRAATELPDVAAISAFFARGRELAAT